MKTRCFYQEETQLLNKVLFAVQRHFHVVNVEVETVVQKNIYIIMEVQVPEFSQQIQQNQVYQRVTVIEKFPID